MNIILEGIDNCGKSTLAELLSTELDMSIIIGNGPPKSQELLNGYVKDRLAMSSVIFDRHPVISQPIYGFGRDQALITYDQIVKLRKTKPLIIYCHPSKGRGLKGHEIHDHDTPEHLAYITNNYHCLLERYVKWAVDNAHIFYRIGDDMNDILMMVKGSKEHD